MKVGTGRFGMNTETKSLMQQDAGHSPSAEFSFIYREFDISKFYIYS